MNAPIIKSLLKSENIYKQVYLTFTMTHIYFDTHQLGPYNVSQNLAFKILNETDNTLYVNKAIEWTACENWPKVLKKDFDGRIGYGEKPYSHGLKVSFKSSLGDEIQYKPKENILNIDTEYLKFTNETPCTDKRLNQLKTFLGNTKEILLFGSVWNHEMDAIQYYLPDLVKKYNVLLAPRHLDTNCSTFLNKVKNTNISYGTRQKGDTFENNEILVLDTLGELKEFYGISAINVVCGGLIKEAHIGGHNPLESLVFKKPTLIGPDYQNHQVIVDHFRNSSFLEIAHSDSVPDFEKSIQRLEKLITKSSFEKRKVKLNSLLDSSVATQERVINDIIDLIK